MTKKLDDELADVLKDDDERSSPAIVKPAARVVAPPKKKNVGLLAALVVMVGALLALVFLGFSSSAVYAVPVDKLAGSSELKGRKVRVEGELVPGTLVKREQPCEYRFKIHGEKAEIPVRYGQCVIPDTFRDVPAGGVQVTVEGALSGNGDFEASLVMAKCASKYDPKTHQMADGKAAANQPIN